MFSTIKKHIYIEESLNRNIVAWISVNKWDQLPTLLQICRVATNNLIKSEHTIVHSLIFCIDFKRSSKICNEKQNGSGQYQMVTDAVV